VKKVLSALIVKFGYTVTGIPKPNLGKGEEEGGARSV
jgi:hypothetical protein|tara:strand:- start:120 stop:230 length:111 start_codon:yes stop_codon:yes gene_type:complete